MRCFRVSPADRFSVPKSRGFGAGNRSTARYRASSFSLPLYRLPQGAVTGVISATPKPPALNPLKNAGFLKTGHGKAKIMAIELGYLQAVQSPGKPVAFKGEISVLSHNLAGVIFYVPNVEKSRDEQPDFKIKMKFAGDYAEIGGAWKGSYNDRKRKGFFLSSRIDGPGMPGPLNFVAWPDDEQPKDTPADAPVIFTLKWSRPQPKMAGGGHGQGIDQVMAAGGHEQGIDDAIPY